MPREEELPEGHDQIGNAVREIDALFQQVAASETAVATKREELKNAEGVLATASTLHAAAIARLRSLVALGKCGPENGCTHGHVELRPLPPLPTAAETHIPPTTLDHFSCLDDTSIPIVWRIGRMLAMHPVLDYQETAKRLYGPTDHRTAKNRVNGHITQLRMTKVAKTLGNNAFEIDKAKLVEKSGRPLPEGVAM